MNGLITRTKEEKEWCPGLQRWSSLEQTQFVDAQGFLKTSFTKTGPLGTFLPFSSTNNPHQLEISVGWLSILNTPR